MNKLLHISRLSDVAGKAAQFRCWSVSWFDGNGYFVARCFLLWLKNRTGAATATITAQPNVVHSNQPHTPMTRAIASMKSASHVRVLLTITES
jgi:hypothetical protein